MVTSADLNLLVKPQPRTSVLYDGGGTDNALQTLATGALVIASTAQRVWVGNNKTIDLWLMNSTAAQGGILRLCQFAASPPTVADQRHDQEVTLLAGEQTGTIDRAAFGLVTGTEYPTKGHRLMPVSPGKWLIMAMAWSNGGVWYLRFELSN